jgi:hypothetical protein
METIVSIQKYVTCLLLKHPKNSLRQIYYQLFNKISTLKLVKDTFLSLMQSVMMLAMYIFLLVLNQNSIYQE